jgi:hypothetical protein
VLAPGQGPARRIGAVESPGHCKALVQKGQPFGHFLEFRVTDQSRYGLGSELEHVIQLQQGESANTHGRVVGQRVGLIQVPLKGGFQRRQGFLVQAGNQFEGSRCAKNFIEKNLESRVRHSVKAQGRFAHFTHSLAQGRDVLSAKMGMQAKAHLQLVKGFGGDPGGEDLGQAFDRIMISLESSDAFFNRKAGFHGSFEWCDTGKGRQPTVRLAGAHSESVLEVIYHFSTGLHHQTDGGENRGCGVWQPNLFLKHQTEPLAPPTGHVFANETDDATIRHPSPNRQALTNHSEEHGADGNHGCREATQEQQQREGVRTYRFSANPA